MLRIFIAIPSMDQTHADFQMSLVHLNQDIFQKPLAENMGLSITNRRGSLLVDSREKLVEEALDKKASHILFLDSDMTFPSDTLHRLLGHNLPAVACNYVQRIIPARSNTRDKDGQPLLTYPDSTGMELAKSAGFGVTLLWADLFKRLSKPWFDTVWIDKENREGKIYYPDKLDLVGEDVFFYRKLKHELDIDLMIDHDLSKEIGHIGSFEYTNNLAGIE